MTISNIGVAVDIATGQVTKLRLPAKSKWWDRALFEDPANVIVPGQDTLSRCAVATGECKQVAVAKPSGTIQLVRP